MFFKGFDKSMRRIFRGVELESVACFEGGWRCQVAKGVEGEIIGGALYDA